MTVSLRNTPLLVLATGLTPSVVSSWNGTTPVANDLLVAVVQLQGNLSTTLGTTPAGWTLSAVNETDSGATHARAAIYTRTATGTSADNAPTWAETCSNNVSDTAAEVTLYDFSDSGGGTPVLATNGVANGTSGTVAPVTGGLVPTGSYAIAALTAYLTTSSAITWTTPSGWTAAGNSSTSNHFQYSNWTLASPTAASTLTCSIAHTVATTTFEAAFVAVISPPQPWLFIGRQTATNTFASATTATITLPAGVNGGDIIFAAIPNTTGGTATTCSVTGFTALSNQVTRLGSAHDQFWCGYRIAAGTAGSATTDTTFAVTLGVASWGEFDVIVLRSATGIGTVTYTLATGSATYTATLAPAVLSPVPGAGDLTVFGYGGDNLALSGTELMATRPTSLSDWPSPAPTVSGNGGVIGMGWGTGITAPGSAAVTVGTATLATVDSIAFAIGVTAASSGIAAGLATATGAALAPATGLTPALATGTGTALAPRIGLTPGLAAAAGAAGGISMVVNAGLATGTGAAGGISQAANAGLATGTGAAAAPAAGLTPGLATGTGGAQQPVTPRTAGLATGTGAAGGISMAANAGLATAAGTAAAPATGLTPALATGTGAALAPAAGLTPGLATGSGVAAAPAMGLTPALATAIGAAGNVTVSSGGTVNAGLATGTGIAGGISMAANAGLAAGTGTALAPAAGLTPGLATGTGTSQPPAAGLTPGLAHGAGTAASPAMGLTSGLATGTGTAAQPVVPRIAGLATGTGAALAPRLGLTPALASGVASSQSPAIGLTPALATGAGAALQPGVGSGVRPPLNLGGTSTPVEPYGGTATDNPLGGTIGYGNPLGGSAVLASLDSTSGGTAVLASPDATSGGTAVSASDVLGGTVNYGNTLGGTLTGWTMQQVNLTLAENNDESVSLAITSSGSPLNLTGATVNMYLKTAAGTIDSAALMLSSAGGSPAITITSPTGGLCTVAIPHADLYPETYTFYRIDVVFSGLQNTAMYGNITWVTL
jgi:hypothetical protein